MRLHYAKEMTQKANPRLFMILRHQTVPGTSLGHCTRPGIAPNTFGCSPNRTTTKLYSDTKTLKIV